MILLISDVDRATRALAQRATQGALRCAVETAPISEVTHLVVGGEAQERPKRTLKLLFALARGAWVVSPAWLRESVATGRVLPPAGFEMHEEARARRPCRPCLRA